MSALCVIQLSHNKMHFVAQCALAAALTLTHTNSSLIEATNHLVCLSICVFSSRLQLFKFSLLFQLTDNNNNNNSDLKYLAPNENNDYEQQKLLQSEHSL